MFAGMEWGVNLVRSETQFNLSAAGPDNDFCCALEFLDSRVSAFMQQPCAQENHAGPATGS